MHVARPRLEETSSSSASHPRIEQLERDIAKLEERQRTLSGDLERPETYENSSRAMELNRELMGVTESLERLTVEWEAGLADLEKMREIAQSSV